MSSELLRTKRFWLAVTAVVVGFGMFFLLVLQRAPLEERGEITRDETNIQACQPGPEWCGDLSNKGRQIAMQLPQDIAYLKPFPVHVKLVGFDDVTVRAVLVEFSMLGMDMGLNRYQLTQQRAAIWNSDVVLPVCVSGRRDWIATVSVTTSDSTTTTRFAFAVSG